MATSLGLMSNSEVDELASMFKQQVPKFSDSSLLRLRSQRQTLHGKISLWWLWGQMAHTSTAYPEIDSADGSKHTEWWCCGCDLYTSSIWGAWWRPPKATIESIRLNRGRLWLLAIELCMERWRIRNPREEDTGFGNASGNDSIRRSTICLQPKAHVVQVYAKVQSTRRSRRLVSPVLRAR
jgi:hypothetical protein